MKRGQSAFEYIMVVGIAMLLIVPGALLFYNYSVKSGDELVRSRIEMAGNNILGSAEKVYYIGENSWETIEIDFPESVRWMYILNNSELVIEYDSHTGLSEAVFFSDINITTDPNYCILDRCYITDVPSDPENAHPGLNIIKITSMGGYVLINETR